MATVAAPLQPVGHALNLDEYRMPFHTHVELLEIFLRQRETIVARIDAVLNCQKKPLDYQQDPGLQARLFKDCFYTLPGLSREQSVLGEQLEQARCSMGFQPRAQAGNDIIDPVQMLLRGLHLWRQTRWPGQKGRQRYAHTLFNLQLLRGLTLLTLRLWDDAQQGVAVHLAALQSLLDQLWQGTPADQPRLVRDMRWLLPVALSPTTDSLHGYFQIAEKIAQTFPMADRVETQRAWVQTGAGHLCAQLRHLTVQRGVTLDDHDLVLLTRRSNALDVALLMEGLVTLLEAYEACLHSSDESQRRALAAAILQGFSPDPELFVNRPHLLGPYSMIELVFVAQDETGQAAYTAAGQRHLHLLDQYKLLLGRLAAALLDDCIRGTQAAQVYSPHGALYGFSSNLLELMAFKTLQADAETRFSLEDIFTPGDAVKRAWVNGWRRLPHIKPEVVKQFEYPESFVATVSARIEQALRTRVAAGEGQQAPVCGRLYLRQAGASVPDGVPALPLRYIQSSDPHLVATQQASAQDADDLLHCRLEGEFLASAATTGGWMALGKDLLTDIVGKGLDAEIAGLPTGSAAVLKLMCPGLLVHES
jgi:hypothetical protein